jgi:hypothetical protein
VRARVRLYRRAITCRNCGATKRDGDYGVARGDASDFDGELAGALEMAGFRAGAGAMFVVGLARV